MEYPRKETCEMDVLTAITTRRSIRKYTGQPVDKEALFTILNAGFCAPSAQMRRPWDFVVVDDRQLLRNISQFAQYQKMAERSAFSIVVCGDSRLQEHHDLLLNDCSAAAENILLAAHGIGLGAVWCGIVNQLIPFFKEALGLPDEVLPVALIAVGHPAEEKDAPPRFDPKHLHFNRFEAK